MLVLASHSPRRREILAAAGIPFVARPVAVDETPLEDETAADHVLRLARKKALAAPCSPGEVILGADTVVAVDGEIFGKPASAADAARMLRRLSGRTHEVLTGVCLRDAEREAAEVAITKVRFSALGEAEIDGYVASGEPMDKAGAYAIQGLASKYVEGIEGCYFNVVGLPVALVYRLLQTF